MKSLLRTSYSTMQLFCVHKKQLTFNFAESKFISATDLFFYPLIPALSEDPEFTESIENITVPAGRNIKLACSVKNLGSYKVSGICFLSFVL